MAAPPARVSALVVTYDHEHEIAACVDAALAQEGAGALEVVCVDNASSDATLSVLNGYGTRITVIARDHNTGYADGVNAAFSASAGELVLLLNPDAVMDAGCVAGLAAHLEAHPRCGAAAALLRDPDGTRQEFARRDVTGVGDVFWNFTTAGRALDAVLGSRHARARVYADDWATELVAPIAVDCPAAACVLVRRTLLEPVPLAPELPLFFNDAELWRRIRRDGWSVEVVPAAGAAHGAGTSVRRSDRVRIRAEWVAAVRRYLRSELGPLRRAAVFALFLVDAGVDTLAHSLRQRRPHLPREARGTLGGLGLPGGPPPWLTPVRRIGPRRRASG